MASLKEKRENTQARGLLNNFHYCYEHTSPFENYTTALQSNFQVLESFDVPLYEDDKLTYLLNTISVKNAYIYHINCKTKVRYI